MVKTSVTIPDDVYKEARRQSENFSLLVSEALKEYLRMKKVDRARASFGKWGKRGKASIDIVKEIRKEDGRRYADRSN
ncbi:MAG: type II toxin-antitoxin system CcdA family antitoxin [Nitrospirae bacterium]|nr:type II toxin-antitoxin system CcdA family antitoxin [Nitrospirota bacterium]